MSRAVARRKPVRRRRSSLARRRRRTHVVDSLPVYLVGKLLYYGAYRLPAWTVSSLARGGAYVTKLGYRQAKGVRLTVVKASGKITNKLHVPDEMFKCECGEAVAYKVEAAHWLACPARGTRWNGSKTEGGTVRATAERTDRPGAKALRNRPALTTGSSVCVGCNVDFETREAYRKHLTTTRKWKCLHSAARSEYRTRDNPPPYDAPPIEAAPAAAALPVASTKVPTQPTKGTTVQDPSNWAKSAEVITDPALEDHEDTIEWFTLRLSGLTALVEAYGTELEYFQRIGMESGILDILQENVNAVADLADGHQRLVDRANDIFGGVPPVDYGKGK